jgi:chemosensory pili system protein ChpA (sensor histidine kinase/response regulator)
MLDALVIDDNRKLADVMIMMLDMLGIKGQAAYGSRSGLMYLQQHIPEIVFLDINMPGVDGFEVFSYIRRTPGCEHIPIFIVTSDDQPDTAQRAHELGAKALIIKPATLDILETELKAAGLLLA